MAPNRQFIVSGLRAGDPIEDFRVGISVGFGTVIGAFITAWAAVQLQWLPGAPVIPDGPGVPAYPADPSDQLVHLKPLARKLVAVLRMSATYDPAAGTLQQTIASVREKMAASSRARPSTLQLLYSFSRRAKEVLAGGARRCGPEASCITTWLVTHRCPTAQLVCHDKCRTPNNPQQLHLLVARRSLSTILGELIKEYNKRESVFMCKINADEEKGIKFLSRRADDVIREVKLAWSRDRPAQSAIPMNLLGSSFLDEAKSLPVTMQDNQKWHLILQPTEAAPSCKCGRCSKGPNQLHDFDSKAHEGTHTRLRR